MIGPFTHPNVGLVVSVFKNNTTMTCVAWVEASQDQAGGSSWRLDSTKVVYTNSHEVWTKIGWYKQAKLIASTQQEASHD